MCISAIFNKNKNKKICDVKYDPFIVYSRFPGGGMLILIYTGAISKGSLDIFINEMSILVETVCPGFMVTFGVQNDGWLRH